MSVTGFTEQLNDRARAEARRHQRIATANRAGWPELERRHLALRAVRRRHRRTRAATATGSTAARSTPSPAAIAAYFIDRAR